MASVNKSYLDLVDACDSFPYSDASDPNPYAQFYAFYLPSDPRPHGFLLPATVAAMPWTDEFTVDHDLKTITLNGSQDLSTIAFTHLIDTALSCNTFKLLHGEHSEPYPIIGARGIPVSLERYAAPLFGLVSRGAHLTVYTYARGGGDGEGEKEMKIWVPRRSKHLFTYPNCLDTTVAGGVTAGEGPGECVVREAGEEASLDEGFVRSNAKSVGVLSYISHRDAPGDSEKGLFSPELIYCFDLEVAPDVVCKQCDDEVKEFYLMGVQEVKDALRRGEFKTNSACVMIDFFIRHGLLTAEEEKDYAEIVARLHRRLPFPTSPDQ
ncbi:Uncharacterized protein LHYA1_G003809 [Lachnellula hyalina]|uniref:Nudix hydrolase domain-containing protein n=1 Tax=Lachnellula hyalina TaxID=1316788 RepID=A0A8H8R230_9HELO|nr:Uncharacterized protein LHYA1_G003809 [Lachnellula hyalina]TVY26984.1 Uncharacterized protein LHYA1_G003809 [Lachnellula hyalina]